MNQSTTISDAGVESPGSSPAPVDTRPGLRAAFVAAVRFLTRCQLPFAAPTTTAAFQACPVFLPLVGLLIGSFTAAVAGAGAFVWPVWLAVIVALAAEALLTGALHEDALADCCDAFGGGWTRDDTLRILKDSRIGAYGGVGLMFGLALRGGATVVLIEQTGLTHWWAWGSALAAAAGIGRWGIVLVMALVAPVAQRDSLSQEIGGKTTPRQVCWGLLWIIAPLALFAVCLPLQCLIAAVVLAIFVPWFCRLVMRRLGGITGDCLGCIGYLAQLIVLLAAASRFDL